jgi:periplasmic protein TonB
MTKLNINNTEWLDLVFEGKNKSYGAYALRNEDNTTTAKAFFISISLLTVLIGTAFGLSSFKEKPIDEPLKPKSPTIVVAVVPIAPKKQKQLQIPQKAVKNLDSKRYKPVTPDKADPIDIPDTKPNATPYSTSGSTEPTKGNPTGSTGTIPAATLPEVPAFDPTKIVKHVDKNPLFPGGIQEFMNLVGKRFVSPELDVEKTIKVVVFFVVERDGTLTNINVPNDPGFGLAEEAIRVLKTIKTKWEPAEFQGNKVRTTYSLPIVVTIKAE